MKVARDRDVSELVAEDDEGVFNALGARRFLAMAPPGSMNEYDYIRLSLTFWRSRIPRVLYAGWRP
jgi:hypothetical protein